MTRAGVVEAAKAVGFTHVVSIAGPVPFDTWLAGGDDRGGWAFEPHGTKEGGPALVGPWDPTPFRKDGVDYAMRMVWPLRAIVCGCDICLGIGAGAEDR